MRNFTSFDYSKFPIIVLTISDIEPTLEEFGKYLNEMENMYKTYDQFVLVFDATKSKYASGEVRALQSKWIKDNHTKIKERCKGMVYVLPNVMIEMVFKCIVAFSPLPVPYSTVRNMESALLNADKFLVKV